MSFLTDVEAQAKQETERVIKELTQLKFDAAAVIHVLNALKLEVPKELRELSPIEVVPAPLESTPSTTPAFRKDRGRKGGLVAAKSRKIKAAEREEKVRYAITEQLSKGPVLGRKVIDSIPYTHSKVSDVATRMKKDGLLDYRTVGFQGPAEWFLPPRPITLETLRDEVVKTEGEIPLEELEKKFGFKNSKDLAQMLNPLLEQGVLELSMERQAVSYVHPRSLPKPGTVGRMTVRAKNFGGGVNGVSGDKISSDKMVREMVGKIKHQGAQVKKTGSNHITVSFAGQHTIIGSTPNAGGFKQDREKLKKMGLRV